ncbi:MAG TPA: hypothetical protein VHB48_20590 [Chitinophagaceae bacterium]|jgi:hypothetical protein|nr:hypothetical protein [Chitinophagaceae bacterium]
MAKPLHDIDKIFKEAQEGYSADAPVEAWDKIQAALDREDAGRYRARFVWWKRTAIVVLVLFCLLLAREVIHTPGSNISYTPAGNTVSNPSLPAPQAGNAAGAAQSGSLRLPTTAGQAAKKTAWRTTGGNKLNAEPVVAGTLENAQPLLPGESPLPAGIHGAVVLVNGQRQEENSNNIFPLTAMQLLLPARPAPFTVTGTTQKKHTAGRGISFAGIYLSADISQYVLDNDMPQQQGANENAKYDVEQREKHEPSFTAGIYAEKPIGLHTGIKAALAFARTDIIIAPQQLVAVKQDGQVGYKYITSSGYALVQPARGGIPAVGDSASAAEAQHRLDVVSVPLSFYYRIAKGRFLISPSAGLSANFITQARVRTELENNGVKENVYIDRLAGSRWFYAGVQFDTDIRYRLAGNWHIGVTPFFRCAFTAITRNNAVKTFPYTTGVAGSLVYKF